jgi:hypothetical protein
MTVQHKTPESCSQMIEHVPTHQCGQFFEKNIAYLSDPTNYTAHYKNRELKWTQNIVTKQKGLKIRSHGLKKRTSVRPILLPVLETGFKHGTPM